MVSSVVLLLLLLGSGLTEVGLHADIHGLAEAIIGELLEGRGRPGADYPPSVPSSCSSSRNGEPTSGVDMLEGREFASLDLVDHRLNSATRSDIRFNSRDAFFGPNILE